MILLSSWMQIPYATRLKLAELFQLRRSSFIHVSGNEVVQDGFTNEDLKELTIERLRQYVGTGMGTIDEVLRAAVKKVEEENQQHVQLQKQETSGKRESTESIKTTGTGDAPQKKRGRPKKQTSAGGDIAGDPSRM